MLGAHDQRRSLNVFTFFAIPAPPRLKKNKNNCRTVLLLLLCLKVSQFRLQQFVWRANQSAFHRSHVGM